MKFKARGWTKIGLFIKVHVKSVLEDIDPDSCIISFMKIHEKENSASLSVISST